MHIAALANSTDESLTMLINGLAYARTSGSSVISAPPLTLYRSRFSANTCHAKGGVEKLIKSNRRHCERSEAIHVLDLTNTHGLPRRYAPRNDGLNHQANLSVAG